MSWGMNIVKNNTDLNFNFMLKKHNVNMFMQDSLRKIEY